MIPIFHNPNDNWQGYDPYKGMNDKERMRVGCWGAAGYVIGIIVAMALCFLFNSCTTTQYVPVVEHHTDTLTRTVHHRDSIHITDSTVIREKGDTVFVDRWHTRWHDRTLHDTIYQATHDSIPVPYPVTKYVERKLTFTQKSLMMAGALAIMALILFIAVRLKNYLP
jgi:hypothetical protein